MDSTHQLKQQFDQLLNSGLTLNEVRASVAAPSALLDEWIHNYSENQTRYRQSERSRSQQAFYAMKFYP